MTYVESAVLDLDQLVSATPLIARAYQAGDHDGARWLSAHTVVRVDTYNMMPTLIDVGIFEYVPGVPERFRLTGDGVWLGERLLTAAQEAEEADDTEAWEHELLALVHNAGGSVGARWIVNHYQRLRAVGPLINDGLIAVDLEADVEDVYSLTEQGAAVAAETAAGPSDG